MGLGKEVGLPTHTMEQVSKRVDIAIDISSSGPLFCHRFDPVFCDT